MGLTGKMMKKLKLFQAGVIFVMVFFLSVMGYVTYVANTRQHGRTPFDAAQIQMMRYQASQKDHDAAATDNIRS